MVAKVYCFASAKGGSGKTMLTANIASFLTSLQKKCLVIDCDAATHGMTLLYLVEVSANPNPEPVGLFSMFDNGNLKETLNASIVTVENGVDLLPATYNFKHGFDPEENFDELSLKRIIEALKDSYDYILLDAQAGSDKYSRLAMSKNVSNEVVIVSEYDPLSAAGIERLKQVIGDDLDFTRTWVLLNKMLPEFVDKFSEFLSITKYLPPMPWNADVVRSYAKRKLAIDLEKGNIFTLAIMRTVEALLGDAIKKDIAMWGEERSFALKEPLEEQYRVAEKELMYAIESKRKLEFQNRKSRLLRAYFVVTPLMVIPSVLFVFGDTSFFEPFLNALGKFSATSLMAVGVAMAAPILFVLTEKIFSTDKTFESSKFERKIEVLEEQLKQLEALRSADLETIVKKSIK
jgi:septum site-determining protein MinD